MHCTAILTGAAVVLGTTLVFSGASRGDFIANLTSDHCSGLCLTGQTIGGTVTVTDTGTNTVSVVVALANGNKFVHTGLQTDFGFNLTGTSTITFSGVTSGFNPASNPQSAGSFMMNGLGSFEYGITCTACGSGGSNPQAGPLDFTIAGAGVAANANGQFFGVDIISGTTGKTGGIDASFVPAPIVGAGLPGLIAACGSLLALARRRRRRQVA